MTNPYQRSSGSGSGSGSGFVPDPLHFGQRRTSYASVASGAGAYIHRPSGFSHLLNPASPAEADANGLLTFTYPPSRSSSEMADAARNGFGAQNGAAGGSGRYYSRLSQLPVHSRAFEPFFRSYLSEGYPALLAGPPQKEQRFFIPSYLTGSTYAQKLEDAHKARVAAQRDGAAAASQSSASAAALMQAPGGGGGCSGGPSGSASNGFGGLLHGAHGHHSSSGMVKLGGGMAPTSHRGLAFEVVEKPPTALDEDESITPLPTRWNKDDKCSGLEVLSDGLEVKYSTQSRSGDRGERDHEACSIRADHYMPPECGIYYFEVTILSTKRDETTIGIGFSTKNVSLLRAPGWENESWGYHGDDGRSFAAQTQGKDYGPSYSVGDVIGCGVNFRTGCAFFTKNGQFLGNAFRDVKGQLFPSVGLKKTGNHIRVNFGQTPFMFGIDALVEQEKANIMREIDETSTKHLAAPLDLEEPDLIQLLVLDFLQHDGYIETARAFAEEVQAQRQALSLDPNIVAQGSNIMDDEDANNRQRIRKAILEGDIDRALKSTNAYYPLVLKNNEHVYFRLRCRKFIEMIRKEAELSLVGTDGRVSSNGISAGGGLHQHGQDMDVDQTGNIAASSSSAWDHMDTEDTHPAAGGSARDDSPPELRNLLNEAIEYGQALQAEYKDDPRREVKKTLEEIFALLAYTNPLKEKEVAHLLDRKGRVAVAEELNSAILFSLGKSERSKLENLWAQTAVLLEDIRADGGPGALVNLQDIVDKIPSNQTH